jgi:hypothetical protein
MTGSNPPPVPTPPGKPPRYLTAEQTRSVYDRIGRIQDLQAVYEHRAITALLAHADLAHAHAVCEFGHGTGALAERLLRDHLPRDARYSGIDISPRMHDLATRRLTAYAGRVELRLGNALPDLPYPDARAATRTAGDAAPRQPHRGRAGPRGRSHRRARAGARSRPEAAGRNGVIRGQVLGTPSGAAGSAQDIPKHPLADARKSAMSRQSTGSSEVGTPTAGSPKSPW